MSESTTFDRLVSRLSDKERRDLLERIRTTTKVSEEPLFPLIFVSEPVVDYATRYRELSPLTRFVVMVRKIFTGRSRDDLVKDIILKGVAKKIDQSSPGLVSFPRRVFLDRMLEELRGLKDAARFFFDLLDRTIEKDKGAFFAFMASLEMEEINQRLLAETNPFTVWQMNSLATEPEIRSVVLASYETILSSIPEDVRRRMYVNVRSLMFLKRLAGFLYDRLFSCFEPTAAGGHESSFVTVREHMVDLADILYSLDSPPSIKLMEPLLVFQMREDMEKTDFNAEEALKAQLARTEEALSRIRLFNTCVPLYAILKLVLEDPNYRPRDLAGGEDWFVILRGFWKDRIDHQLQLYTVERRLADLQSDVAGFLGTRELRTFKNLSEEGSEGSPPIRIEKALAFLSEFYDNVFVPEMNRPLKILLIEGEFYKKDNRVEYTDAYNGILQVPEALSGLDERLAPGGDLGAPYLQARSELVSLPIKRRKVQSALQTANLEAEGVLNKSREAMKRMQLILKGVLKADPGSKYDSLSNLSFIEGKSNREYLRSLDSVRNKMERAVYFLNELEKLGMLREST